MNLQRAFLSLVLFLGLALAAPADPAWTEALRAMPLDPTTPRLNRANCVAVTLGAFRSNAVVKALLFLPGVSDDFYLIHRDDPALNIQARTLLEAVTALTNRTEVRVTYRAPFLLLHVDRDLLEPDMVIRNERAAARLKREKHLPHAVYCDRHWEALQPELKGRFPSKILPAARSEEAWHFNRHNLAGWGLSDWEWLEVLSLTGRTTVIVERSRLLWRVNTNAAAVLPPPRLPAPAPVRAEE